MAPFTGAIVTRQDNHCYSHPLSVVFMLLLIGIRNMRQLLNAYISRIKLHYNNTQKTTTSLRTYWRNCFANTHEIVRKMVDSINVESSASLSVLLCANLSATQHRSVANGNIFMPASVLIHLCLNPLLYEALQQWWRTLVHFQCAQFLQNLFVQNIIKNEVTVVH